MFRPSSERLTMVMAITLWAAPLGCNFTMEPDPGASTNSEFPADMSGFGGDEAAGGAAQGGGEPDPQSSPDATLLDMGLPLPSPSDAAVPEAADGGQGAADFDGGMQCADIDGDGLCEDEDLVCNLDDQPITCDREPPACADDQVPVAREGCFTGQCVTWDECGGLCRGPDADGDGVCDEVDPVCNTDEQPLNCRRMAPVCAEGEVPKVTEGCYTGECVTWDQCLDVEPMGCMGEAPCPDDQWCRETIDPMVSACVPYRREGEACGGFVIPSEAQVCHPTTVCSDRDPRLPDGPGVCRLPCGEGDSCEAGEYCAVSSVCRESGGCFLDADCLRPGNDFAAPLCEGWAVCGEAQRCEWYCGDPRCTDLLGVEFGACERVLGVARIDGVCTAISGCQAEGYQLFDDMEQCVRGCR